MKAFPLYLCKAITYHKIQGTTIATGEPFEKVVLHYQETRNRVSPILWIAMMLRPKGPGNVCIGNKVSNFDTDGLKYIETLATHSKQRAYHTELKKIYKADTEPDYRVRGKI